MDDPLDDPEVRAALRMAVDRARPDLCRRCHRDIVAEDDDLCRSCTRAATNAKLDQKKDWWHRRGARNATKLDRAVTWLKSELRRGPQEARRLYARAERAGITERTLRRAAEQIGVDKQRRGQGRDHRVHWSI